MAVDRVRLSEDEWMAMVTQLATLKGWSWLHIRPAQRRRGWVTPVAGDLGAGWPDLYLVRGRRQLYAELKADNGALTEDQRRVHGLLRSVADVEVWRPDDWPRVMEALA